MKCVTFTHSLICKLTTEHVDDPKDPNEVFKMFKAPHCTSKTLETKSSAICLCAFGYEECMWGCLLCRYINDLTATSQSKWKTARKR